MEHKIVPPREDSRPRLFRAENGANPVAGIGESNMEHAYSIKLSKIVKDLNVEMIYSPYDLNDVKISSMDVNRPGLQLGGFFEYFDSSRIQLIGMSEYAYLKKFSDEVLMQHYIDKLGESQFIVVPQGQNLMLNLDQLGQSTE